MKTKGEEDASASLCMWNKYYNYNILKGFSFERIFIRLKSFYTLRHILTSVRECVCERLLVTTTQLEQHLHIHRVYFLFACDHRPKERLEMSATKHPFSQPMYCWLSVAVRWCGDNDNTNYFNCNEMRPDAEIFSNLKWIEMRTTATCAMYHCSTTFYGKIVCDRMRFRFVFGQWKTGQPMNE